MPMSLNASALDGWDSAMLQTIAQAPYADARDLIALSGRHSHSVEESVKRLHSHRLVRCVFFANGNHWWVRRWYVTGWGVLYLSMLDGSDIEAVMRGYPVSLHWQKRLLQRIDRARLVYRIAQEAANATEGPVQWKWYGKGILEGILRVGDLHLFGVAVVGRSQEPQDMARLLGLTRDLQHGRGFPEILVTTMIPSFSYLNHGSPSSTPLFLPIFE